jgi:hypothetical protein
MRKYANFEPLPSCAQYRSELLSLLYSRILEKAQHIVFKQLYSLPPPSEKRRCCTPEVSGNTVSMGGGYNEESAPPPFQSKFYFYFLWLVVDFLTLM